MNDALSEETVTVYADGRRNFGVGAIKHTGPLGTWGYASPLDPHRLRETAFVGVTWRPHGCPSGLCRRRFRSSASAYHHDQNRHPAAVQARYTAVAVMFRAYASDAEIAKELGLKPKRVWTIRRKLGLIRTREQFQALMARRTQPIREAQNAIVRRVVANSPGLQTKDLYRGFLTQWVQQGQAPIGYSRFHAILQTAQADDVIRPRCWWLPQRGNVRRWILRTPEA